MKRVEVAPGAVMTSDICEYILLPHLDYLARISVDLTQLSLKGMGHLWVFLT